MDQDSKEVEGHRVSQVGPLEVWVKSLEDSSQAVGLFNRGESANPVTVNFNDIGVTGSLLSATCGLIKT